MQYSLDCDSKTATGTDSSSIYLKPVGSCALSTKSLDVLLQPTMASARVVFNAIISVMFIVIFMLSVTCLSCYVFPADIRDPCRDKRCSFGAQCVPSLDGLTARCQCPERCDNYGDSVDSTPICATDGQEYTNRCEMRRAACSEMRDIEKKYDGKCGTYSVHPSMSI